jgi:hypothetical protein
MKGVGSLCLWLCLVPSFASAADAGLGMSVVETKDLKLFYLDPLDFLTPHSVRTFTN